MIKSAKFYFSSKIFSSEIIKDTYTSTEILHNDLKGADDTCSFKVPFSVELSNLIQSEIGSNKIKIEIKDENENNVNTYYVKDSITIEKTQKGQPISISAVSPSFFLDATLPRSIVMIGKSIGEIITQIFTEISFSDYNTISISETLTYFVANEDDNAKTIINELLYEYGYVLYFDENGLFAVKNLFSDLPSDTTITQIINGNNAREKISITVKEKEADYVSASYSKIEYKENALIFSDTQNADSSNKCLIEIASGYYLFESSDEKTSSSRTEPKINYLDYDSTLGEVKYVSAITSDVLFDNGLTYSLKRTDEDGNDLINQASLWAYNPTNASLYVRKLDIYGNAYIATARETVVSSSGTKIKEIDLSYIYDKTSAEKFAVNLANYYRFCNFEITAKSFYDFDLGSYVKVTDYGIGTYYGRVIQKKRTLKNDCIEYKIETISDYTPAEIEKTSSTRNNTNAAGAIKGDKGEKGDTGEKGADGKDYRYTLDISPEAQSVSVDEDNNLLLDEIEISAYFYDKETLITDNITYKAIIETDKQYEVGTWNNNVLTLATSYLKNDVLYVVIKATFTDENKTEITRQVKAQISKLYGVGTNIYKMLFPDGEKIKVDNSGNIVEPSQLRAEKRVVSKNEENPTDFGRITLEVLPNGNETDFNPYSQIESSENYSESKKYYVKAKAFLLKVSDNVALAESENVGALFFSEVDL